MLFPSWDFVSDADLFLSRCTNSPYSQVDINLHTKLYKCFPATLGTKFYLSPSLAHSSVPRLNNAGSTQAHSPCTASLGTSNRLVENASSRSETFEAQIPKAGRKICDVHLRVAEANSGAVWTFRMKGPQGKFY